MSRFKEISDSENSHSILVGVNIFDLPSASPSSDQIVNNRFNNSSSSYQTVTNPFGSHRSTTPSVNTPTSTPTSAIQVQEPQGIWSHPFWQPAGVIATIIFSVSTIVITLRQFQTKSLTYEIKSKENIIKIAENSIKNQLQILYKSQQIQDLYLVTVKFMNSGNIEIKPEDYSRPLSLSFGSESRILASKVIDEFPNNLGVKFMIPENNQDRMSIEPLLLNKKDYFVMQLLVTGFQELRIDGRIAGVRKIEEVQDIKWEHIYSSIVKWKRIYASITKW